MLIHTFVIYLQQWVLYMSKGHQHYFLFILLATVALLRRLGDACEMTPVVSFL